MSNSLLGHRRLPAPGALQALHRVQAVDAISRTKACEPSHAQWRANQRPLHPTNRCSDWEELDCEASKTKTYRYSPAAFLSCFLLLRSWPAEERKAAWTSWFCQYLGVPIPKLQQAASPQPVCPRNKRIIDVHGDHIHTRKKHTGSRKDAQETILTALEQICNDPGLTPRRQNIPSVEKSNSKPGRGDLVIKDAYLSVGSGISLLTLCVRTNLAAVTSRTGQP